MSLHPSRLPLQIVEADDRVTVSFPPKTALSESNAEELAGELRALAGRRPHLLVDLSGVTMLTSVVLGKLLALNNAVRTAGGRLTLSNPTPVVREVFRVSRLDKLLDVGNAITP